MGRKTVIAGLARHRRFGVTSRTLRAIRRDANGAFHANRYILLSQLEVR
jgi:hypothetical protein